MPMGVHTIPGQHDPLDPATQSHTVPLPSHCSLSLGLISVRCPKSWTMTSRGELAMRVNSDAAYNEIATRIVAEKSVK
jgi:hypothetical protein